jgi:hypothetical protein
MIGFLLAGLTYENYVEVLDVADLHPTSKNIWGDHMKLVMVNGRCLLEEQLELNIEEIKYFGITIVTDGAWSHRGWSANECAVSVFEITSGKLLDLEIVIRCLPSDSYGNYSGASSQMESEGLRRICKRLKDKEVTVSALLHDGDGSSFGVVSEFWKDVKEISDNGHAAKNFRKAIIKLAKSHPEVSFMGETCLKAFRFALTECNGSPTLFTKIMWRQYEHFYDWDHEHCTHSEDYEPVSWNWVTEHSAQVALKAEFKKIIDNADKYCQNLSSNVCEAFANSRTKFTDKRLNQRIQFPMGAILAALSFCARKDMKFQWKKSLLEKSHIPVSCHMEQHFIKETEATVVNAERYLFIDNCIVTLS